MTFLDLFAGIGGFRRGLERSGQPVSGMSKLINTQIRVIWQCMSLHPYRGRAGSDFFMCKPEVRKNCDEKNCKGEWFAKDIKQIGAGKIPKAEIWAFGFPCVDISIAGHMEGIRGSRSELFFTVVGLLKGTNSKDRPQRLIVNKYPSA